jgi:hypothetical protein
MTRGNEIMEQLSTLEADYVANRDSLVEELKEHFGSLFVPIFEKSSLIESVSWTQYTNYFNDGDPCNFNAHTDEIYINEEFEYEHDWYSWEVGTKYEESLRPAINREESLIVKGIKEILDSFSAETLKKLFGDHKQITIMKDGTVNVGSYTRHD